MLSNHEKSVQDRVLGSSPQLPHASPSALFLELKAVLVKAHKSELLTTPQNDINKWVKLDPKLERDIERPARGAHVLIGGEKDFDRKPSSARLVRDDGAWIHFTITVDWDAKSTLILLAYDFEIVFRAEHSPRFVRFDLNPSDHSNDGRELRSHIHPGNDDLLLPAPVLTPVEILHVFLHGLRPRRADKPRA